MLLGDHAVWCKYGSSTRTSTVLTIRRCVDLGRLLYILISMSILRRAAHRKLESWLIQLEGI